MYLFYHQALHRLLHLCVKTFTIDPMIATITFNTAIDRCLFVPSFRLNATLRVTQSVDGMGGKPLVASWVLRNLGIDSLALGFAAGPTGESMQAMLKAHGVKTDWVWVGGDTRQNTLVICEDGSGQTTLAVDTLIVEPQHIIELRQKVLAAMKNATCLVCGSGMPKGVSPELHAEFITAARTRGIPVVFDASGSSLSAGIKAQPTVVKPNRDELFELTGEVVNTIADARRVASLIYDRYGTMVVATLGELGAVAVFSETSYYIPIIPVQVVNAAGAGDAITAGLALALSQGLPLEEGLRIGFAAATASLLTASTGECDPEDVMRFKKKVILERM
jgi:1-phosphofructokinase family hexose kinase